MNFPFALALAVVAIVGCGKLTQGDSQTKKSDDASAQANSGGGTGSLHDAAIPVSSGGSIEVNDAGYLPPAGNERPDSGTKFDYSASDILQHSYAPITQAELDLPHTWNESCDSCNEYQFCDRDHCAYLGQGGIAYAGGMYGRPCMYDPTDLKNSEYCGTHVCMNGLCRSCRTDEECCWINGSPDPTCLETVGIAGGGLTCLWLDRIQSNACMDATGLASKGIDLTLLTPH